MPKKTKRQKIIAAYHKKARMLVETAPQPSKKENPEPAKIQEPAKPTVQTGTNAFFYSDLKKSLFLVTAVIALEIALYFAKLIK